MLHAVADGRGMPALGTAVRRDADGLLAAAERNTAFCCRWATRVGAAARDVEGIGVVCMVCRHHLVPLVAECNAGRVLPRAPMPFGA